MTEIPNDRFELIPCPVCGGQDLAAHLDVRYGQLKQKRSLDYSSLGVDATTPLSVQRCRECRLVFVNPRIKREHEEQIYNECKTGLYTNKPELTEVGSDGYRRATVKGKVPRAHILLSLLPLLDVRKKPVLFDYGCGFGYSMSLGRELGMETYGVDIDQERLGVSRRLGLDVAHPRDFDDAFPGVRADIVMMQSIIEHVVDLPATMEFVRSHAAPGALLWMNGLTPGTISIEKRRGQYVKAHFLEHLNYFPIPTLDRFMRRYGFAPIHQPRSGVVTSLSSLVRLAGSYLLLNAHGANIFGGTFTRVFRLQS